MKKRKFICNVTLLVEIITFVFNVILISIDDFSHHLREISLFPDLISLHSRLNWRVLNTEVFKKHVPARPTISS